MLNGFSSSAPRRSLSAVKKEIEELSPEERQRVYDDIYGRLAESKIDDTPELEDRSLHELDRCIQDIEGEERACYDRAVELCPEYVHDRAFRILFLRADLFDAKCAANRMVKYWSEKFKLWGEERAYRANPITINDFDETDLIALEKGGVRSLPSKDKSKRRLIIIDKTRFDQRQSHRESMLRLLWYMYHVALEDVDAQKNGIVNIAGTPRRISTLMDQDRKLDSRICFLYKEVLPVRIVGIHHFVSNRLLEYFVPVVLALFGSNIRRRYILHIGTEESFLNELSVYGIDKASLPQDIGGTDTFDYESWIAERRSQNM